MKNLLCQNPAIILNPRLKELVCKHGNYTIRGEYTEYPESVMAAWCYDFPYKLFGTRKLGITLDDLDECYILDKTTGDLLPIYMAVPCNKCVICRDKSARDWSTRAMCEAQTSQGYPLFVTLTYNDRHLPTDGVHKEHCQMFLKRLRINLNRYLGRDVNLRFFLCSEYGSKTQRPHYHVLLYNFPSLDTLKRSLSIIERSWSYMVTKDEVQKYSSDYKFYDKHTKRWRVRYGFVHVQMAQGGHVKYAMKYMRKDATIPDGKNDVFYLSSRRRGLGYQWLEEHMEEYKNNPQLYDVQFLDIWSQTHCTFTMPNYFKNILYPTISRVIPKETRDIYGKFVDCLNIRNGLLAKINFPRVVYSDEMTLLNKFRPLPTYLTHDTNLTWCPKLELKEMLTYVDKQYSDDGYLKDVKLRILDCYAVDEEIIIINDAYHQNEILLATYSDILRNYVFDADSYEDMRSRNNQRLYELNKYMDSQPQSSVVDRAIDIYKKRQRQRNAEYF